MILQAIPVPITWALDTADAYLKDQARHGNCLCLSHPGRSYGRFLNRSGLSLCQFFIACKGGLLPRADCGSCWL